MRSVHESNVTANPHTAMYGTGMTDSRGERAAGVWTFAGDRLIIAEPEGPATILVPAENVRLLAIELPLPTRAKRLEALPYAIEDRIADSLDSVHLALGAELAPGTWLVAVVRDTVMQGWVDAADAVGLGHAAMVPDALALPVPADGGWAVDLGGTRAVVRAGDGTGFACPATLLMPAWEAAGRPAVTAYGAPLPEAMGAVRDAIEVAPLARRLLAPAIDLRQGRYRRRRGGNMPEIGRRLVWIVGLTALAHTGIAAADTLMLRAIADRRENDTRALVALAAPGATVGEDVSATATDLLTRQGSGGGAPGNGFVPLVTRVSAALAPVSSSVKARAINYEGKTLTFDLDPGPPDLRPRIEAALKAAHINGSVTEAPDHSLRVTANP